MLKEKPRQVFLAELLAPQGLALPKPQQEAYFPETGHRSDTAPQWVLDRTNNGQNLVGVIAYGSAADGTKAPDSMEDYFVVVKDIEAFNQDNLRRKGGHLQDYGYPPRPHSARLHTALARKHAPSFHYTEYATDLGTNESIERVKVKYAVLSLEDFEKGCKGSLGKAIEPEGDFGLYVAGRIQKAPLRRIYWPQEQELQSRLESGINKARIDGLWLALGTLPQEFSLEQLAAEYVSLSYRVDSRIEDPNKVRKMIGSNADAYAHMLTDLLEQFQESGIVSHTTSNDSWTKIASPFHLSLEQRFRELKQYNRKRILKNTFDAGLFSSTAYELQKIKRVRDKIKSRRISAIGGSNPGDK